MEKTLEEKPSLDEDLDIEGSLYIKTISLKIPDTKKNPKNRATIRNVTFSGDESFFESKTFKNKQYFILNLRLYLLLGLIQHGIKEREQENLKAKILKTGI